MGKALGYGKRHPWIAIAGGIVVLLLLAWATRQALACQQGPTYGTLTVTALPDTSSGTVSPSPAPLEWLNQTGNPWSGRYANSTNVTLTASPKSGKVFERWEGSVTGTSNPIGVTIYGSVNVTARFTDGYTITRNVVGSGSISLSPSKTRYIPGESVTVTALPAQGWRFDHWEGDLTGTANPQNLYVNSNKSVTAVFALARTLTMSVRPALGGSTSPGVGTSYHNHGSVVDLRATPYTGYRFVQWSGDASGTAQPYPLLMDTNRSVTANFAESGRFLLTADWEGAGSVSPTYQTYAPGAVATVTASASTGWRFSVWRGDPIEGLRAATQQFYMWADHHVHAVFVPSAANTYYLHTAASGPGTVSPPSGPYPAGTRVQVAAQAENSSSRFVGWAGDDVDGLADNPVFVTMDSDKFVKGLFAAVGSFRLRLRIEGPGRVQVNPDDMVYPAGTVVNLHAIPNVGAYFETWRGDVNSHSPEAMNPDLTIVMDSDKDLIAVFQESASETANDDLVGPKESTCINEDLPQPKTDPILPATGTAYLEADDVRLKGRGIDFVWTRTYRSRGGTDTPMGHNWDFSYNARVARSAQAGNGQHLIVIDGSGRRETFLVDPSSMAWSKPGSFSKVRREDDGTYSQVHPDGTVWRFHPLCGPTAGKLMHITDRNGNRVTFAYSPEGRLATVTDTIGRVITVNWVQHAGTWRVGSLSTAGKTLMSYQYYDAWSTGGGSGDLEYARRHGLLSDYRQTTYTYSKGFSLDARNHNLLTILDPRGGEVRNEYFDTNNTSDIKFDRVKKQTWGDGDTHFEYVAQTPSSQNQNASVKVIVNDRLGHVREYWYDAKHRLVWYKAYTGAANPTQPTLEDSNRPSGRVRSSDPPFYEQKFRYNSTNLLTHRFFVNLAVGSGDRQIQYTYRSDHDPTVSPHLGGGIMSVVRGEPGGLTSTRTYGYNSDYGCGGCSDFVSSVTDEEGNTTTYTYDAHGNRTEVSYPMPNEAEYFDYNQYGQLVRHIHPANGSGHHRTDLFTYQTDPLKAAFLRSVVVDAGGLNLTVWFECDDRGNITSVTDPRNGVTTFTYNAYDELIEVESRPSAEGRRYKRKFSYDKNGNITKVQAEDANGLEPAVSGGWVATDYTYNSLNQVTSILQTISDQVTARTRFRYDPNGNLTEITSPEAVAGRQTGNITSIVYDELDRVLAVIEGHSYSIKLTTRFDYDESDNIVRRSVDYDRSPRVYTYRYDALNRVTWANEPNGNTHYFDYTQTGLVDSAQSYGYFTDWTPNLRTVFGKLSDVRFTYDGRGRLVDLRHLQFDPSEIGGTAAHQSFAYAANSQPTAVTDERGSITLFSYDTANRLKKLQDPLGNTREFTYDANSNVTSVTDRQKPDPAVPGPDHVYRVNYAYDPLDRVIRKTYGSGFTGQYIDYRYDARDNLVAAELPWGALSSPWIGWVYDGLNRPVETRRRGTLGTDQYFSTFATYDANSRVTRIRDAQGRDTQYAYDEIDRLTAITYADGTADTYAYNANNWSITATDAAGTVVTDQYDYYSSIVNRTLVPGPGILGDTTFQTFYYDGLGRLEKAVDDDSTVRFAYDSLSNVIRERIGDQQLTHTRDLQGNSTSSVYPGGTFVNRTYDVLGRLSSVAQSGSPVASYKYLGPNRVLRRDLGNGTRMDVTYDAGSTTIAGHLGYGKPVGLKHWRVSDGALLAHIDSAWQMLESKVKSHDAAPSGPDYTLAYDRLGRMSSFSRSGGPGSAASGTFSFDTANNRTAATGIDAGAYTQLGDDALMNRYTTVPWETRAYDRTGALTAMLRPQGPGAVLDYDALGQLVRYRGDTWNPYLTDDFNDGDLEGWTTTYGTWGAVGGVLTNTNGDGAVIGRTLQGPDYLLHFRYRQVGTGSPAVVDLRYIALENRLRLIMHPNRIELSRIQDGVASTVASALGSGTTPGTWYDVTVQLDGERITVWRGTDGGPKSLVLSAATSHTQGNGFCFRAGGPSTLNFDDVSFHDSAVQDVRYAYDALGRRIAKTVAGAPAQDRRYLYDGWQLIEERSGTGAARATFVYGNGLDEPLSMRRGGVDYFYHQDEQGTVRGLSNLVGNLVERYEYGPSGLPAFYNGANAPLTGSAVGNPFLFTGREWDAESRLYQYRYRYLEPRSGRFLTRDPLGAWADPANLGNPYAYVGNSPWDTIDPLGLSSDGSWWGQMGAGWDVLSDAFSGNLFPGPAPATGPGLFAILDRHGPTPASALVGYGLVANQSPFYRSVRRMGGFLGGMLDPCQKGLSSTLDDAQWALDAAGMIPVAGEAFDLLSATISAARGDWAGAGISVAAMVPFLGWSATTAKAARRNYRIYEALAEVPVSGLSRGAHRQAANRALLQRLERDAQLRGMYDALLGQDVMAHMRSGKGRRLLNPPGTVWHHPRNNPSVMHLLTESEHADPLLQDALHPSRIGGYAGHFGGRP